MHVITGNLIFSEWIQIIFTHWYNCWRKGGDSLAISPHPFILVCPLGHTYLEQCESKHYLYNPVDIEKLNDEGREGENNLTESLEQTKVY